jgi:3-methyladenine DNA glycosylase/8-oxoguanine DNA glycosylase
VKVSSKKASSLYILTPQPFDFEYTAHSHGWSVLPPNQWATGILKRVERLSSGAVVALAISSSPKSSRIRIQVNHSSGLSKMEKLEIKGRVSRMLRLGEDLTDFYRLCLEKGGRWVRVTKGLGRLLRSPSVFEDVVKTICTTNIQWSGTKRMISGLVREFGDPIPGVGSSFPSADQLAGAPPGSFTETVRLGYRGEYIRRFAERVASKELDIEKLDQDNGSTEELNKQLLSIKGVGNYAAATLLMLLGRYDQLPVDTVFREFVSRKYFKGMRPPDQKFQTVYDKWGKWKYLAYWFDIWSDDDEKS